MKPKRKSISEGSSSVACSNLVSGYYHWIFCDGGAAVSKSGYLSPPIRWTCCRAPMRLATSGRASVELSGSSTSKRCRFRSGPGIGRSAASPWHLRTARGHCMARGARSFASDGTPIQNLIGYNPYALNNLLTVANQNVQNVLNNIQDGIWHPLRSTSIRSDMWTLGGGSRRDRSKSGPRGSFSRAARSGAGSGPTACTAVGRLRKHGNAARETNRRRLRNSPHKLPVRRS